MEQGGGDGRAQVRCDGVSRAAEASVVDQPAAGLSPHGFTKEQPDKRYGLFFINSHEAKRWSWKYHPGYIQTQDGLCHVRPFTCRAR